MSEIVFPALDQTTLDREGVLATWFVAEGEVVSEGQLLGEVQVDKVDAELTSPGAGVIHLLVAEGDAVRQGVAIARIEAD